MDYPGIKMPDPEPDEPYISPYPKVTRETAARKAKPRSSRVKTDPKKPCEKKFICPLCKKGFSRRQTVFDPHFASCIKKNGNPQGLEWDDDPSCQEAIEGQPGLFKSSRVAPGSVRAMKEYGNLARPASEAGGLKTNGEDDGDTEAEEKDVVDDVRVNADRSSELIRGPQESVNYQYPDTYGLQSNQPRVYHHKGNHPEVGPGTDHVGSSRDNSNNVYFSQNRGVDPSLTAPELDKAKPLRTTQTASVSLKVVPLIKQSHHTPFDPVLSNPTRRDTADATSINDSHLFQTKPPAPFANSHIAQPLHLDRGSVLPDQSTVSPVVPKNQKRKEGQRKTIISPSKQEGPRIQDNPYAAVTASPIQLDFITIQTSILRSLMAGIVRDTSSKTQFQGEQSNMAASSHDKHGSGEAGSSTLPANPMTTAFGEMGAMGTYGTNTRGLSQPVEAGPSKPGLEGKRRLTEQEAAAIIKYLCGPNEEVPNIMGNSLKHANSWLIKEHGSLMEIIRVLDVVLGAKVGKNQGGEPIDDEEGSSTEEAASQAAESTPVPDAIGKHQIPSPVDYEEGSDIDMHEAASPAEDSSPEPKATMENSTVAAAQMALQTLQNMAADIKTLADSKNIINLVKESLISLGEENEVADINEIIEQEIKEITVEKPQPFQFLPPAPVQGGRRVVTAEERAAFLHKYSGYPHLYDNDYP